MKKETTNLALNSLDYFKHKTFESGKRTNVPVAFDNNHRRYKRPDFLYLTEDSWPIESVKTTEKKPFERGRRKPHVIYDLFAMDYGHIEKAVPLAKIERTNVPVTFDNNHRGRYKRPDFLYLTEDSWPIESVKTTEKKPFEKGRRKLHVINDLFAMDYGHIEKGVPLAKIELAALALETEGIGGEKEEGAEDEILRNDDETPTAEKLTHDC
ncbi:unnamed protein product [Chrysodeixis includens]|uniref:Uncharacterized protein n=1 Tax=Chrysodeixis includens TaxID=689277 RepID=A0A9N8L6G2_CHRIL|nr:unnamed protein product [Chrysodeixis includens]